jgi:hypothetical protein
MKIDMRKLIETRAKVAVAQGRVGVPWVQITMAHVSSAYPPKLHEYEGLGARCTSHISGVSDVLCSLFRRS